MKNKKLKNKNPELPSKDGLIEFILMKDFDSEYSELELKRSIDIVPSWYKDLPPYIKYKGSDDLSLKKCIPFLDALNTGYYLVTKKDYSFSANLEREEYSFSSTNLTNAQGQKTISSHPMEQVGNMPFSEEYIKYLFKWNNPYQIKTPENYGVLFTHPMNWHHLPFYTLSGLVDTDKFPIPVLFPFLMKNNFNGIIPAGTPVVQIIPIKKEDWKHIIYIDTPKEYVEQTKHIINDYMAKRIVDGKIIGGIYKKVYRNLKKYL